jgi:hypothetical protein
MLWIAMLETIKSKLLSSKRQLLHVGGIQFDAVGHPLGHGIGSRALGCVARLISTPPKVHSDGPTSRQMLSGQQQHRATATP